MRSTLLISAAAALICVCVATPLSSTADGSGRYIIKLKPKTSQNVFLSLVNEANNNQLVPTNKIKYRYSPDIFNGVAGEFSQSFIRDAADHPEVEYIEADGEVHAFGVEKNAPSWGLARISSRQKGAKDYEYPENAGSGVEVYVVDTGVQESHSDFKGRAKAAVSFVDGEPPVDNNGHGTHCAGTIASYTYGVAKDTKVIGVKVLNRDGSGSFSGVIKGIEYVGKNAVKGKVTVMSMSLGGGASQAIDDAITAVYNQGVLPVVAAGNDGGDSCSVSPARCPNAFTVGATDINDSVADFSNTGKCTKIHGPGVDITSLWIGRDGATNKISGTSMATPHVAGLAAVYISQKNYSSPKEVMDDIIASATKFGSDLTGDLRLVYIKNEKAGTPTDPPPTTTTTSTTPTTTSTSTTTSTTTTKTSTSTTTRTRSKKPKPTSSPTPTPTPRPDPTPDPSGWCDLFPIFCE